MLMFILQREKKKLQRTSFIKKVPKADPAAVEFCDHFSSNKLAETQLNFCVVCKHLSHFESCDLCWKKFQRNNYSDLKLINIVMAKLRQ